MTVGDFEAAAVVEYQEPLSSQKVEVTLMMTVLVDFAELELFGVRSLK